MRSLLIILLTLSPLISYGLSFEGFLQAYPQTSDKLLKEISATQRLTEDVTRWENPEEVDFGVSFAQSQPETESWDSNSLKEVEVSTKVKLATGTEIQARALRQSNKDNRSIFGFGDRESIRLTQPLNRNFFGREIRKELTLAKHKKDEQVAKTEVQRQAICSEGAEIYSQAYMLQEQSRVLKTHIDKSTTLKLQVDQLYKKNQILPLEHKQYVIDIQSKKQVLLKLKGKMEKIKALAYTLKLSNASNLQDPLPKLELTTNKISKLNTNEIAPRKIWGIQKMSRAKSSQSLALEKSHFNLDLVLELGNRRLGPGQSSVPFDSSYGIIGIKMDWSILAPKQKLQRAKANQELQLAKKLNRNQQLKLSQADLFLKAKIPNLKDQIQLTNDKIKKMKSQVKIAKKDLISGRLKLNQYRQITNQYISENLDQFKNKFRLSQMYLLKIENNGSWKKWCQI